MKRSSFSSGASVVGVVLAAASLLLAGGASAQPVISSLNPAVGPPLGGTTITLEGTNLDGEEVTVTVGSELCSITLQLPVVVRCTTPAGTGLQDVRVHVDGVSSNPLPFQYHLPMLLSVAPIRGPANGGTLVTVRGQHLGANPSVRFGSALASLEARNGDNELVVRSPPGTGAVPVVIVQEGGAVTSPIPFTYDPCPAGTVPGPDGCSGGPDAGEPDESDAGEPDESDAGEPDDAGDPDEIDAGETDDIDAGEPDEIDAGEPDEIDAGETDDIDAGAPDDVDAGASGEMDAGASGDIDAGDEGPACVDDDGCCEDKACPPTDRDPPSGVAADDPGVPAPGCAGSGMPSGALSGLALLLLALHRRGRRALDGSAASGS